MGRVSRFLKVAADKSKEPEVVSPTRSSSKAVSSAADSEDLARLIACWEKMPAHLKQTIRTLVEVTEWLDLPEGARSRG